MALLPSTEPPHWGVDETEGLLERVAGENASLPCPAQGEAKPQPHPSSGTREAGLAWVPGTRSPYSDLLGLWSHPDNSII